MSLRADALDAEAAHHEKMAEIFRRRAAEERREGQQTVIEFAKTYCRPLKIRRRARTEQAISSVPTSGPLITPDGTEYL